MRIEDLGRDRTGGLESVGATIVWEDSAQDPQHVHFSTSPEFADGLVCNPNAFLLASVIPAMQKGERRVRVEGRVCPKLRNGLVTAMQILREWYGDAGHSPVEVEATEGFSPPLKTTPPRIASFMSGGADSLATVRCNRMDFLLEHPESIRDCIFVHGFDLGGYEAFDKQYENYEFIFQNMLPMASDAQLNLIPVYTNLRFLEKGASPYDNRLFTMESHGAAMAAVAHAFSARLSSGMIASTNSIPELAPLGSHPVLDPNFSSAEIDMQHDGARFERLQKVEIVANWPSGFRILRACQNPLLPVGVLNCGECEKCTRTMTELLVLGKLKEAVTYPCEDMSALQIRRLRAPDKVDPARPYALLSDATYNHWKALTRHLSPLGRGDLIEAIEEVLADYGRYRASVEERDWKGVVKRTDRQYLGGNLRKLSRRIKGIRRGR